MSQDLVALLAGAALAIAALAYVLQPLFTHERPASAPASAADDDIEARVRALRQQHPTCAHCGVRPEPDAIFCSHCGRALESSSAR